MPKVSVIIPSYNHANYIAEAVDSVLTQTEDDLELILIDDGSTDNSLGVLSGFTDQRLRIIPQSNQGAHAAINRGLDLATGKYLAILNSDDAYYPTRLEKCILALENNPESGFVGSYIEIINSNSKRLGIKHGYKDCEPWLLPYPEKSFRFDNDLRTVLLTENYWATTSNYFFSYDSYQQIGGFRHLRYTHDWDYALRMSMITQMIMLPEPLIRYRVHESNTIRENQAAMIFEICWIIAVHLPEYISGKQVFDQQPLSIRIDQLLHSIYVFGMDRVLNVMLLQELAKNNEKALKLLENGNPVRARYMEYILDNLKEDDSQSKEPSTIKRNFEGVKFRVTNIINRSNNHIRITSPAISLIMPTYNRAHDLQRTLAAYDQQDTTDRFEILVIDDGSRDSTFELLSHYSPSNFTLHVLKMEQNQGQGMARNKAIPLVTTPLTLFVGDDMHPEPGFVQGHIDAHRHNPEETTAILGKVKWPDDLPQNTLMVHIDGLGAQQFSYYYLKDGQEYDFRHFYTCNISVKSQYIQFLDHWFDPDFYLYGFEDVELGYRLAQKGMHILYDSKMVVNHYHYHTIWSFSKRQYNAGAMAKILLNKHPELYIHHAFRAIPRRLLGLIREPRSLFSPFSSDFIDQMETRFCRTASCYEWQPNNLLDKLYITGLNYFFFDGLIRSLYGDSRFSNRLRSANLTRYLLPALEEFSL